MATIIITMYLLWQQSIFIIMYGGGVGRLYSTVAFPIRVCNPRMPTAIATLQQYVVLWRERKGSFLYFLLILDWRLKVQVRNWNPVKTSSWTPARIPWWNRFGRLWPKHEPLASERAIAIGWSGRGMHKKGLVQTLPTLLFTICRCLDCKCNQLMLFMCKSM